MELHAISGLSLKSHCPLQPHFQGPEPAEPSLSFQLVRRWGLSGALDKRLAHQESRESCSHKGLVIDQSHKKGLLQVFRVSTMPVTLRSVRETRRVSRPKTAWINQFGAGLTPPLYSLGAQLAQTTDPRCTVLV